MKPDISIHSQGHSRVILKIDRSLDRFEQGQQSLDSHDESWWLFQLKKIMGESADDSAQLLSLTPHYWLLLIVVAAVEKDGMLLFFFADGLYWRVVYLFD
jgi:hypothetical protein